MKRFVIAAALCLSLTGCGALGLLAGQPGAAYTPPARSTTADEKSLTIAFMAYDAVLDLVEIKVDNGSLKGDRAVAVKRALTRAWSLLQAAKSARAAISTADYAAIYSNAIDAIGEARDAIKGA